MPAACDALKVSKLFKSILTRFDLKWLKITLSYLVLEIDWKQRRYLSKRLAHTGPDYTLEWPLIQPSGRHRSTCATFYFLKSDWKLVHLQLTRASTPTNQLGGMFCTWNDSVGKQSLMYSQQSELSLYDSYIASKKVHFDRFSCCESNASWMKKENIWKLKTWRQESGIFMRD